MLSPAMYLKFAMHTTYEQTNKINKLSDIVSYNPAW